MSITTCPECKGMVSTLAAACPHCGAATHIVGVGAPYVGSGKPTPYRGAVSVPTPHLTHLPVEPSSTIPPVNSDGSGCLMVTMKIFYWIIASIVIFGVTLVIYGISESPNSGGYNSSYGSNPSNNPAVQGRIIYGGIASFLYWIASRIAKKLFGSKE